MWGKTRRKVTRNRTFTMRKKAHCSVSGNVGRHNPHLQLYSLYKRSPESRINGSPDNCFPRWPTNSCSTLTRRVQLLRLRRLAPTGQREADGQTARKNANDRRLNNVGRGNLPRVHRLRRLRADVLLKHDETTQTRTRRTRGKHGLIRMGAVRRTVYREEEEAAEEADSNKPLDRLARSNTSRRCLPPRACQSLQLLPVTARVDPLSPLGRPTRP